MEYWRVTDTSDGIVITCAGHDREGTVTAATRAFELLAARRAGAFRIIADLREMTGYESEARKAWQDVFTRFRTRIQSLVLVGARSAFIRMGAATVGAFVGVPVKFIATMDELANLDRSA